MPERDAALVGSDAARSAFSGAVIDDITDEQQIQRFIVGVDTTPRAMTEEEIAAELEDPFAVRVLRKGVFPTTVHEVLEALDRETPEGDPLRRQLSFLLGEGTQILWSEGTRSVPRGMRLAVTRGADNEIDLLVSTAATGDLSRRFLQVMGWDETHGVFHFYERQKGLWVWAGQSSHALEEPSRGRGPFDSHVNGSLVMKELKAPWIHWHSVDASVPPEVFAPDDPARDDVLFTGRSGAEFFETAVVRPGIRRWTRARLAATTEADGTVRQVPFLLRQLFETTTVNLVSSFSESRIVEASRAVDLPRSFFADTDSFTAVGLALPPGLQTPGSHYLAARDGLDTALVADDFRQPDDTHFAFLVPERAAEDIDVVSHLLEVGLLTDRFIASVLMIDFPNPVFSARRARLARYAPDTGRPGQLVDALVDAIRAGADDAPPGEPEHEFLEHWALEDGWRAAFDERLTAYYEALTARLGTADGFGDVARLAEARRRRVRELELSEGRPLLFATTAISDSVGRLVMRPDATVAEDAEAVS